LPVLEPSLKLYWCWTVTHQRDWFVVARTAVEAKRQHGLVAAEDEIDASRAPRDRTSLSRLRGGDIHDKGGVHAKLVMPLPAEAAAEPGVASLTLLEGCGARVLRESAPRVVAFGNVPYVERRMGNDVDVEVDDLCQEHGLGRPNGTRNNGA
jgi:hypothetical protein